MKDSKCTLTAKIVIFIKYWRYTNTWALETAKESLCLAFEQNVDQCTRQGNHSNEVLRWFYIKLNMNVVFYKSNSIWLISFTDYERDKLMYLVLSQIS